MRWLLLVDIDQRLVDLQFLRRPQAHGLLFAVHHARSVRTRMAVNIGFAVGGKFERLVVQALLDGDHFVDIRNLAAENPAYAKRYQVSLNDPDLRRMYDYEMSAKRDQASREYNAEMKGRTDVIRGMLRNGIPVDVIYKCVDASRADVDAIIAKIRAED